MICDAGAACGRLSCSYLSLLAQRGAKGRVTMAADAPVSHPGPNFSHLVAGHSLWVQVFAQAASRAPSPQLPV